MMKLIKRFFALFALLAFLTAPAVFGFSVTEAAKTADWGAAPTQKNMQKNAVRLGEEPLVYVEDGLYLISKAKQEELTKRLEAINAKYGVHVGIHIVKNLPPGAKNIETEAMRFVESGSYNQGVNGSMVLYVTMGSRKYYVATGNYMNKRITSATGIPYICDEIVPAMKDNEFDRAAELFVDAAEKELQYYEEEGKPYDPADDFSFLAAALALVCSGLVGFCVCGGLISQMSNVGFAEHADEYLNRDSFELTASEDTYLYTTTTVVPKSRGNDDDDDDSGSSSSGGSGSSGGGGGSF